MPKDLDGEMIIGQSEDCCDTFTSFAQHEWECYKPLAIVANACMAL